MHVGVEPAERGRRQTFLAPDQPPEATRIVKPAGQRYLLDTQCAVQQQGAGLAVALRMNGLGPLREQTEVVGHAVRAMYIYSGMADVAAETGDRTLVPPLKRLWENVTAKRMHVTGGLGPTFRNEGFTFDYDLPNENAYQTQN
jgi:hypothetical protein